MSLDLKLNAEYVELDCEHSAMMSTQSICFESKKYCCESKGCGKLFKQKSKLRVHSYSHLNVKPFRCTFDGCDKEFVSKWNLKTHYKLHCQFKSYKCYSPNCQAAYYYSFSLRKHLVKHGLPSNCFTCSVCKIKFSRYQTLINHIKTHEDSQIFLVIKKGKQANVPQTAQILKEDTFPSQDSEKLSSTTTTALNSHLGRKTLREVDSNSVLAGLDCKFTNVLMDDLELRLETMKNLSIASMDSYSCALQPLFDLIQNLMNY